ncbi:retrovirus-related pol polyprotein from transposon TNT 1-94 [Tanacetum coccineum]
MIQLPVSTKRWHSSALHLPHDIHLPTINSGLRPIQGTKPLFKTARNMGNATANQSKVGRCYNYKGEGHMARQCFDEAPSASAVLMAKLSAYDSDVLSEVPTHNIYQDKNLIGQSVQEMHSKQQDFVNNSDIDITMSVIEEVSNQVAKCNAVNQENKSVNESLTTELERYKEMVIIFEERQKFDLTDREKYIDSKMRAKKWLLSFDASLDYAALDICCGKVVYKNPSNSGASLFIWAEAVATTCYTQNRSLIRTPHNKTPYELMDEQKPDLKYLHVFGSLCYLTDDNEDLGKLKPKFDIGIFIGYSLAKQAYQIYNKWTRMIMETIHVEFDELTTMASEQFGLGPEL